MPSPKRIPSPQTIALPASFPQGDYTPFGYLDNPAHTTVLHPSGVVRSVPPLGFGFWARPVTYGFGMDRLVSYLALLHLSVFVDEVGFHTSGDFSAAGVRLASRYHTKTMMSYDWEYGGVALSAKYYLADEHALVCVLEIANRAQAARAITVHATTVYGFPARKYWGCDGVVSAYRGDRHVGVSKVWAYGDVVVLGADRPNAAYKATASREQWNRWVADDDLSANAGALLRFAEGPDHLYTVMSYRLALEPGAADSLVLCLARGVNEAAALQECVRSVERAIPQARQQLAADQAFYAAAPLLTGDWPDAWKHGWIYDWETIRMTIRPPVGIYRHPWDGMQIHAPRSVLGEMSLDTLCLSYADVASAKEVIYGTFADAPAPNVPCSREDGSMNMIGESSAECGTAPNWGFPFLTIRSIYLRDRDDEWIRRLYPYLKAYLDWWLENRTDEAGWFHADCSWESGQDGSRRFLVDSHTPGAAAASVRTVDIEAAVAHAMTGMIAYAEIAGHPGDVDRWRQLAAERVARLRTMYVDGWFRDVDARLDKPIVLPDYYDVMMLSPATLDLATADQIAGLRPKFQHFRENPKHWLEWPPFVLTFAEAGWNAGLRDLVAQALVDIGHRMYARLDARELQPAARHVGVTPPAPYDYRLPGVANEYWPLEVGDGSYPGCENYGWGAILPALVIRCVVGFREQDDPQREQFYLAPALPASLFQPGRTYGLSNLRYRQTGIDVRYEIQDEGRVGIRLRCRLRAAGRVVVRDEAGRTMAQTASPTAAAELSFEGINGALYGVSIEREPS